MTIKSTREDDSALDMQLTVT